MLGPLIGFIYYLYTWSLRQDVCACAWCVCAWSLCCLDAGAPVGCFLRIDTHADACCSSPAPRRIRIIYALVRYAHSVRCIPYSRRGLLCSSAAYMDTEYTHSRISAL